MGIDKGGENICNSCIHRRVCQMRNNEKPTVKICIERVEDNGIIPISGWKEEEL